MTLFSRRIILGAVAAGATAAAIAGAVPAYALSTVTVAAGSAPAGTLNVQGTAGTISLKDFPTNATGSCTSSTLTGTTKVGSNVPNNVAQIKGGVSSSGVSEPVFNSCTTLGLPFSIKGVGTGTKWTIEATANTTSGTTPINIKDINVAVSSSSCTFNVSGTAAGSYVNGTPATSSAPSTPSKIVIPATTSTTATLSVSNIVLINGATKCLGGAVTNTNPANKISLSGTYTIGPNPANSAYEPVTAIAS